MARLAGLARRLMRTLRGLQDLHPGEQESRFKAVFDISKVAMLWATPDGRIIRANRGMADLVGYEVDELQNMPYENLLLPEDRDEFRGVLAEEAYGRMPPKHRERRYLRKDGRIVWGLRSVTLVMSPSGAQLHKFIIIQDITERKAAQEALLEEERTLAVLNWTAEKLNAELDLEALLQAVTDAGVQLTGADFGALFSNPKASDGDGGKLYALSGIEREAFETLPMKPDMKLFEPVFESARIVRGDDLSADAGMSGAGADTVPPAVLSYFAAPLVSRSKEVIGALFFGHPEAGRFGPRSERIMAGLALHAAIAIEKASLFDAARREIEARKKIEASLNESEARFREFAEVGSDILWETDAQFRITSIVGDAWSVLGVSEEAVLGKTRWAWAKADVKDPQWKRHIEDHEAWRPFRNFEYQIFDERGNRRWLSANGRPYFDRDGRFIGYRGASRSIAARKHAEAKLAESARQQQAAAVLSQFALRRVPREELFTAAVELVARTLNVAIVGILELSADKRVLRLKAGTGWPEQSVNIRAVPVDFCPPLARGVNSDVPVHFSRRNFNLIPDLENANGAGVVVPFREASAGGGGVLVVCSSGFRSFGESDINFLRAISFVLAADAEQRRTEETLRLRDRALEAVGQGILITDAAEFDNPLIYVNPAFESITGYSREESVGRNARFLQGPDTDKGVVQAIRSAVETEGIYRGSILNRRKDGSSFWNALTISPILDQSGRTTHFVGILSDETERVRLESQLRQAQKMESLGHLTGGIAHDFNNLLAVILGNSEILWEEIDDPEMKEIAELVMTTAEKGADLTQRLLAFGRRQALRPENLDLKEVIGSLSEMLSRTIGDHVTLKTRTEADRPAHADRSLFESAVLNLVLNARDAMPNGGELTIATDVVRADGQRTDGLQPGDYVQVTVTDTGRGMTKEVLDRAFDPFFTTKIVGKGSGMGLSMVYGFVKQSGGHVTIESRVGHGTSVRMFIPAARTSEKAEPTRTQRAAQPAAGGSERILLVEDEPQLRRFVQGQLTGLGYDVLEAEAGAPALDILRSNPEIDLLFTDLLMPGGMSGFDLVARARELRPHIKVLLTTGYAAETESMIANIRDPILKKPYKKQQLAAALRNVLECAA